MDSPLDEEIVNEVIAAGEALAGYLFSRETLVELGVIGLLAIVAWSMSRPQRTWLTQRAASSQAFPLLDRGYSILVTVAFPLTWLLLQWLANLAASGIEWRDGVMIITASLLTAWVVIRIASAFIRNPVVGKSIAIIAWTVAALNIVGWIDETVVLLDSIGMSFGEARISLLTVFKGVASLAVLLWASNIVSEYFESRIRATSELTPSVQVLFAKLFKIVLLVLALLVAVSAVGIDLTAFAVVGGAIGVGVGFGLQKIVSNLVSGVILLVDDSIKPGDVIAVGEYYGKVESLGARYVSVATRDGIEHLIPNEDLIINRVENWTHSNPLLRLRLGVGVHYKSDVKKAMRLCLEGAQEAARVLEDPKPVCLMRGFGDSSVNLEVRYWINDPMNGRANVASDILVRIWDKFAANDIEIPYPQRDIHLRTPDWDELKAATIRLDNPAAD